MKNYAVNLASKHHRLLEEGERPLANETVVTANADGGIEGGGGEGPLPEHGKCDHIMRFTPEHDDFVVALAGHLRWTHENLSGDIIAYRPIIDQPASEEPNEWCGEGLPPVGEKVEIFTDRSEWEKGIVIMHHDSRALVYLDSAANWRYESRTPAKIRPIRTPRDQWIEKAKRAFENNTIVTCEFEAIYDAMIDGTLPTPGSEQ